MTLHYSRSNEDRNRIWNIDVFGVLRGKYLTPAFAIKIGETAIRNCFASQLRAMRQEGSEYMGVHPCVFTEIGIPYDMDDKYAYRTGNYSSQISAMDANHFGLEASNANGFALWTYVVTVRALHRLSMARADSTGRTITTGATTGMARTYRYTRWTTKRCPLAPFLQQIRGLRSTQTRPHSQKPTRLNRQACRRRTSRRRSQQRR